MTIQEKERDLLEKAEVEEKVYNWKEAVELYEKVVKSLLSERNIKKAAEIYYKLCMANYRGADTVDTPGKRGELLKNSGNAINKAASLYNQIGNKPGELESKALDLTIRGLNTSAALESKNVFNKSLELFIKAS